MEVRLTYNRLTNVRIVLLVPFILRRCKIYPPVKAKKEKIFYTVPPSCFARAAKFSDFRRTFKPKREKVDSLTNTQIYVQK